MTTSLDHWRDHPERWPELAGTQVRQAVLRLLLRDRRDTDAVFLRYLLDQEIRYHEDGWGYDDSLGLAALLLNECGEAGDVWQLSEAKYTSVDTSSGLDAFLLFPAGVAATLEHVERSDHPDRDEVSADLREHLVHDPGLDRDRAARLAGLREYYSG
ncbi:hypothetical protein [Amycolatopsis vancoresmycina]|uniref:Uncharacterized protein n=1 Tax=Amycolatopsis vancoresmycina DSM 44592 TaxID=1292037 RepID=R1I895_9PSEU|nr:hypothetical protein [Amycolatopsis vancoresmycina]EOD68766.1 hypothetical protein H480_09473 [Amycolatopsis vancoresmycina DSM 44592]